MNVNHTAGGYDEKGIDVADVLLELSFVPRIRPGGGRAAASSFQGNIAFDLACAVACVGFS